MTIPDHVAARIERTIAGFPTTGLHVDHQAARYGAIALVGSIGTLWMLRPDGTFWDVDDDLGKPLTPLPAEEQLMALVYGVERYPWLAELLPVRPPSAPSCGACSGVGSILLTNVLPSGSRALCTSCQGLGWVQSQQ